LSNQLFKLFLDPSLTYSSGIFAKPDDSLERAQQRKVAAILEKARISPGHSVLEIGSGWGTLALQAAEQHACRVKSISLSQEQLALARERAQQRGLSKLVDFEYCDYRQVTGSFDSIVSVEMMEAVGKEYLPVFFKHCDRLLKPDGTVVLQVIAFPEAFYSDYLRRQDFIQKHIFPGSHLPTLAAMLEAVSRSADFVVEHIENIGPHYAPTLAEWRRRFEAKQMEVQALGFDQRFSRLWNFYLASCEAQFSTRWLQVYQIVLMRPNNQREILRFAQREQPEASKEIVGMKRAS
jgi:cyclopropane-fatty-acyl-phospholipid synthase